VRLDNLSHPDPTRKGWSTVHAGKSPDAPTSRLTPLAGDRARRLAVVRAALAHAAPAFYARPALAGSEGRP
jgi:hypothetical protein